jgi:type IV pilus assembly protein PilO
MAALSAQRRRFTSTVVAMGVVCLFCGLYLIGFFSGPPRDQELLTKQSELRQKEDAARPIQRLPQLVEKAKTDIGAFSSDRLTAFPSTVYNNIYDLARKNNVALGEMKYETFDDPPAPLKLLHIQARVSGGYANLVRFINAVERNKLFFVVRDLQLSDTKGQNSIQLTLSMDTLLRPRQPNEKPGAPAKSAADDEEGAE